MSATVEPVQTADTIGKHLRYFHGYDLEATFTFHPTTLLSQHDRIHQQFSTFKVQHDHESAS